ncbi:MAG: histidine kinase, partial [Pseudomonadota bacterium]
MASVTASTTRPKRPERNPASEGRAAPSAPTPVAGEGVGVGAGEDEAAQSDVTQPASDTQRPRGSLARRMGLIAAAWITVLLVGGGIALDRTLTSQVESNFDEQLEYILTAMISSAEIDPLGEVYFELRLG